MDKSYARSLVLAEWNGEENRMHNIGQRMVFDDQVEQAHVVHGAFLGGASLVTFMASPQWGKTGMALALIKLMTTHVDDDVMIHPDNVFFISGMSDKDWRDQTKTRMLRYFRDRVYHRNDVHKIIDEVANKKDVLIVIDECHYGSIVDQTLHKCLKEAGVLNIDRMLQNNIKLLCISATPCNVLIDAQYWGTDHHQGIVAKESDGYTSFKHLLEEGRVRQASNLKKAENVRELLDTIVARYGEDYRYHIIRASDKSIEEGALLKALKKRGYIIKAHNSKSRLEDIECMLNTPPANHQFIIIKGFWRAAKTLNDRYIGLCFEGTSDYTAIAQGLGGRLLGYGKQRGEKAPLLYVSEVEAVHEYVELLEHNGNYYQCKKYTSAALKVCHGVVTKQMKTTCNPEEVANLEAVDPDLPTYVSAHETVLDPKKLRIVQKVPRGAQMATQFGTYSIPEFLSNFRVSSLPDDAAMLSEELKRAGFKTNVSYSPNAAKSVANLVNFYNHKGWAACEYHIIKEGIHIHVIKRDIAVLKSLAPGATVCAHNYKGDIVLYRVPSQT